jgi:hypothetical protein
VTDTDEGTAESTRHESPHPSLDASADEAAEDTVPRDTDTEGHSIDPSEATADQSTDQLDASAGAFLSIEDRLRPGEGPWRAVGVEVVAAEAVPAEYPRSIETAEALELRLESPAGGATEPVYLPFPPNGVIAAESDLGRLLDLLSIPADRFGDLHGKEVPVAREEDALVLDVAEERRQRGSDRAILGLLGGYGLLLAASLLALLGVGWVVASPLGLGVLAILHFVVLPLATYLDGWYLRSTTGWGHAPGLWAILAILPGVNLVTTALYLLSRNAATAGR